MKYVIIEPQTETVRVQNVKAKDFNVAIRAAGLTPGRTDHGVVKPGLTYFVYEYGLFDPLETTHYAGLDNRILCAGNILISAYDEGGETIDTPMPDFPIRFYHGGGEVEAGIARGEIIRPYTAINNEVIWTWPDKR
jgi:hypothetical protein